ncbi:uncharacterized protein VICG_00964 [Vittaforma corneae ATCC 50505]|uniref:Kinesin-like protein n=1 Tax=Vittaforma corneae (strain ATCC 50505) TaxID=993615 RepID=L2GNP6_VITCO|nr:uncharacterized protein VICG_00964 [Vittaforma corneae ATCC 50505]ELA41947.1 hypothetical protein VICG_00964 [Vittaforma corneae ATCC 50505]
MPNVCVEVRIRPNSRNVLEFSNNKIIAGSKIYTFSKVHNRVSQTTLFNTSILPYVERFVSGENCTILAYGQTGSGKTYTMGLTHINEKGIIQNSLECIFKRGLTLACSFIEIYNEEIYDLMSEIRVPLNLRQGLEDINIVGLTETEISSYSEALEVLQKGNENRTTKSTKMNVESSRSHAMFTLSLRQTVSDRPVESRMSFVDLAGSERLKRTECSGHTARESISINAGLLSLGNVISALYLKKPHVPFRDSKLTRILQKCLNGYVLLISCVSGLQEDLFETTNTLKYASRAALIALDKKVHVESDKDKQIVLNLKKEISALKDENNRLRAAALCSGFKNEKIRNHPVVVELISRLRRYESEDAIRSIVENTRNNNASVINKDGRGSNSISFANKDAVNSNVGRDSHIANEVFPKSTFVERIHGSVLPKKQNTGRAQINEKSVISEADIIKENIENISKIHLSSANTNYTSEVNTEEQSAHANQLFTMNQAGMANARNSTTNSEPSNISTLVSSISNVVKMENVGVSDDSSAGVVRKKRTKLVSFDLEPKPKKNILFTPLKETRRVSFNLIETVTDQTPLSFIIHQGKVFFNCADSKIRAYDSKLSSIVSDDCIRCLYSSANLYYSSRSLLKMFISTGRSLPVYAYKNEISSLTIQNNLVFTGHEDGSLNVLDIRSNEVLHSSRIHSGAVFDMILAEGKFFSCSRDHSVKFNEFCADRFRFSHDFISLSPPHYDSVSKLLYFKDRCISLGRDCAIKVWNDGQPFKTVPYAHDSWIKSGSSANDYFVTGCKNGIVKCWDFIDHSVRCVGRVDVGSSVNCMLANGNELWVGAQSKKIYRYCIEKE